MGTTVSRMAAIVAAVVLVACGNPGRSEDLAAELESAAGAESQLLPRADGVDFVSAIEQNAPRRTERAVPTPRAETRVAKAAPAQPKAREQTPPVSAPVAADASTEAPATAPAVTPTRETAPRGVSLPQGETRRPPPGGWKSPSEVIRNAPFPINP